MRPAPQAAFLVVLDLPRPLARAERLPGPRLDLDPARPHRLGHLARQLDRQQPVLEPRVLHLDVVGELEAPLERAGRDAAVQVLRALLALLAPAHHQQVGLRRQLQLVRREARHGHGDPVPVLARPLDVVGRPVVQGLDPGGVLEQVEDAVEADARPEQGGEVVSRRRPHSHILR
jgi:hypothetical protein